MIVSFLSKHYRHAMTAFDKQAVLELMKSDKKNESAQINFVLLKDIGMPLINQHAPDELISRALDFILEHSGKEALQP